MEKETFDLHSLPVDKLFSRRLILPGTWVINCFDPNMAAPHPHLVEGDDAVLLIDTTWTQFPLREYAEQIAAGRKILVFSTHAHFDHTNANYQFDDCPIYMSETAWRELAARREKSDEEGKWTGFERGTYIPNILKVGDPIDLGNRRLEAIPYTGIHSPGSLMLLDEREQVLFPGDEIDCGQILISGKPGDGICVEMLRDDIKNLLDGYGDRIRFICPPHNGSPVHAKFLEYLLENCSRILSGIEGMSDVGSMTYLYNPMEDRSPEKVKQILADPKMKRSEWMGTSIVYNVDRIFKSQVTVS